MAAIPNLKNIQKLLNEGFSEEELRNFCFVEEKFRPLSNQLPLQAGKNIIIRQLLEYIRRKGLIKDLLAWAKEENPAKYHQHRPYYSSRASSKQVLMMVRFQGEIPEGDLKEAIADILKFDAELISTKKMGQNLLRLKMPENFAEHFQSLYHSLSPLDFSVKIDHPETRDLHIEEVEVYDNDPHSLGMKVHSVLTDALGFVL